MLAGVAAMFEVLAEPHRRRILDLLRDDERPVGELVAALEMSQPAVSKHLRVLREAGLVRVRGDAQRRLYRVDPEPLREIDEWLAPYRARWTGEPGCAGTAPRRDLPQTVPREDCQEANPMTGTLEPAGERWRLRFVRRLRHDPQTVWQALTEPEHLKVWFPDRITATWTVGGELRFSNDAAGIPDFAGRVLAVDPPRLLEFTWGPDVLRFEIAPDGDGCVLTLLDTFDEQGKAARDAAGWHGCLDQLAADLDGTVASASGTQRWKDVHAGYVEEFGAPGSTIGPPEGWDESGE